MREIKFRALVNGEWFYFDLTQNPKYWAHKLEDGIIDQYTGLKDVNDVEIYEGDIVKSTFSGIDGISLVYSDMEHSPFNRKPSTPFSVNLYPAGECCIWRYVESYDVKIIGNIYENKDLLEDNKNE